MNVNHSPSSILARPQGASIVQVESNSLVPWMLFACIMAGLALGLAVTTIYIQATAYRELEREVRLQRLETDELGAALARAGIPTHRDGDHP